MSATAFSGYLNNLPWTVIAVMVFLVGAIIYGIFVINRLDRRAKTDSSHLTKRLAWATGIAFMLLVAFLFYNPTEQKAAEPTAAVRPILDGKPLATAEELKQARIVDRNVFLADITKANRMEVDPNERHRYRVSGKTFINCKIHGPAVVPSYGGNAFIRCEFLIPKDQGRVFREAVFCEVEPGTVMMGEILLDQCTFNECVFEGVAFTGTAEQLDDIRQGIID